MIGPGKLPILQPLAGGTPGADIVVRYARLHDGVVLALRDEIDAATRKWNPEATKGSEA